jgi:hypothetical protein
MFYPVRVLRDLMENDHPRLEIVDVRGFTVLLQVNFSLIEASPCADQPCPDRISVHIHPADIDILVQEIEQTRAANPSRVLGHQVVVFRTPGCNGADAVPFLKASL